MMRLGILGSTRGTNMLTLIQAIKDHRLPATIQIVLSNQPKALILDRAKNEGIQAKYLPSMGMSRTDYDRMLTTLLIEQQVDFVVLIGYMRILTPDFVRIWDKRVINVHPSLLPLFAGKMDNDVHESVLKEGVKETGCTIHYVTDTVDAGPIILQKTCPVLSDDTPQTLKERVQALEGQALIDALLMMQVDEALD